MTGQRDGMWSAYMDGELSASEAAEFDQSLTSEARKRLTNEIGFERGLVDILRADAQCPDLLWRRVHAQLLREAAQQRRSGVHRWFWRGAGIAAAALIVVVGVLVVQSRSGTPAFLRLAEADVAALAATSEVPGDLEAVREFLLGHGIEVDVEPPAREPGRAGHDTRLLGAREGIFRGDRTVELLFDCCGEPMKLVLARQNGPAAEAIGRGLATGLVQASEPVGSYVSAVVGRHESPGLVEYVRPRGEKARA